MSATTAGWLLAGDGFDLERDGEGRRSSLPVVMLSDTALALMRDLFGRPELLAGRPRIERRIVAWGGADPVSLPHGAITLSGAELLAALPPSEMMTGAFGEAPDFIIHGAPPFPGRAARRFGSREAEAAAVDLVPGADRRAAHVEATPLGWLFLIPQGGEEAWLLGVGGALEDLLAASRLVAGQIGAIEPVAARFETAPRMLETLAGEDWLACGTGAIAFDPICGDGTAQALREAILAAAVLAGLRDGGDRAALLGHYEAMLIAAMRRHLQVSLPFYQRGGQSPWWQAQVDALADGHRWCTARLAVLPEPRFTLLGTRLVPREAAA